MQSDCVDICRSIIKGPCRTFSGSYPFDKINCYLTLGSIDENSRLQMKTAYDGRHAFPNGAEKRFLPDHYTIVSFTEKREDADELDGGIYKNFISKSKVFHNFVCRIVYKFDV